MKRLRAAQDTSEPILSFNERGKRHAEVARRIAEAYPMVGTSSDDSQWRSLTSDNIRDLNILTQRRMQDVAFYLYDSNPMAGRIIEIIEDFVIGDGFTFSAVDPDVKEVLENFWNDPDNNLDEEMNVNVVELFLFGELCLPVWVNSANGAVKLSYVDPKSILKITKEPNNPKINKTLIWKKPSGTIERELKIINVDRNTRSKTYGYLVGECFYSTINKVSSATRGRSALLRVADWCLHPDTLINTLEGNIPIKDLVGRKEVLVYSWDTKNNELVIAKATNIRKTRENTELVKIHFTNGDSIITTPDHLILLINSPEYRKAGNFLPSDRVQALSEKIKDDYVWVQYKKNRWMLKHRFIMGKMLGRKLSHIELVHHKNGNTLDNRLENLQLMSRPEHALFHIEDILLTPEIIKKNIKRFKESMKDNKHALGNKFNLTQEQKDRESNAAKLRYLNMTEKQKEELRERNIKASHARFQPGKRINQYATFNHEVLFVEKLDYKSDVYDLTVEQYGNFAANGIMVHNCDGFDQFLFSRLERAFLLNNFIWDITCEGMNKTELEEFVKTLATPKPGSIRAHNEKITWKAETPKLESADASDEARLFKQQILGGVGLPEHWMAEGSNTTRATSLEMSAPVLKSLKSKQKKVKFIIKRMFAFAIDQAIIAGTLKKDVDKSFKVIPSPIVARDNKTADSINGLVTGLAAAKANGWINDKKAKTVLNMVISQMGVDMESDTDEGGVNEE